ncbi:NAD-dependent epimerase/dehydratase family protein [Malaciobacter mytili]|uniref:NAD-dependent epimerase/dehydratase family protein n=1 Tax=Malaciobacter mytili TaxID=603050 RepID=UPI001D1845B7|nr:NAD-dependent epimerase/dehydratase family protein [Malaciobacter mytili]
MCKFNNFRYFNVAGADVYYENENLKPQIGQSFPKSTHLIKIASECACFKREEVNIFGTDYNTYDGTGIRDYIHVDDLADVHVKAIKYLDENPSDIFNVGYGYGYSVKEVLKTMKKVSGVDIKIVNSKRREGDPAALISNTKKIKSKMNWQPKYDNLDMICFTSYLWEKNLYKESNY